MAMNLAGEPPVLGARGDIRISSPPRIRPAASRPVSCRRVAWWVHFEYNAAIVSSHAPRHASPAGELLRQAGLRVTPQRLAVAREVALRNHPTVAQVYEAVRGQYPAISLATVYATLNTMTGRGLVRALPFEGAIRYDANVDPHANLVCTACGTIADLDLGVDILRLLREQTASRASFHVEQERVDLYGVCAACQPLRG